MQDTVIGDNAKVNCVIADKDVSIKHSVELSGAPNFPVYLSKKTRIKEANIMKVLFVASEALPFMASGGLGDVAGSLPAALRKRLIGCRVVMPLYDSIPQELKDQMQFITSISVPVAWRRQYCGIFEAKHNGVIYYLLDNQYYFKRDGIYGHYDDAERFAFFARAVLEIIPAIDWKPDINSLQRLASRLNAPVLQLLIMPTEWGMKH